MKIINHQKELSSKTNITKFLPSSSLIQPKLLKNKPEISNIHCRSMQQLELYANPHVNPSVSKQLVNSNMHHSSLFNEKQNSQRQHQPGKSKSLSKFISFFENSNLLKANHPKKDPNQKRKNYNGFCYDFKISSNSTANNKPIIKKKDKENINSQSIGNQNESSLLNSSKSPMIRKNDKNLINSEREKSTNEFLVSKMKDMIEQHKKREAKYCQKIEALEANNKELQILIQNFKKDMEIQSRKNHQYEQKIRQLETKNKQIFQLNRSFANKEQKVSQKSAREQDMVIKSLKRVISQQLNKIIELERVKFENQYLRQKLAMQQYQSFSQTSSSHQDYSFENQNQSINAKSSFSSAKSNYVETITNPNENFKKSKPGPQKNIEPQKSNINPNHFKTFFQIEESPISEDDNINNLFKPSETKKNQGKAESIKLGQKGRSNMIKITEAEASFSRQAIEEVNEENYENPLSQKKCSHQIQDQQCQIREEQDSILEEVDQYLTKWRNH